MTGRERHIADSIRKKIKEKNSTAEVILYGSRARGDSRKESDWDILILLDESNVSIKKEQEYRHHLFDLELEIGEPISVYVHSKEEWEQKYAFTPLYRSIKNEGILLK